MFGIGYRALYWLLIKLYFNLWCFHALFAALAKSAVILVVVINKFILKTVCLSFSIRLVTLIIKTVLTIYLSGTLISVGAKN